MKVAKSVHTTIAASGAGIVLVLAAIAHLALGRAKRVLGAPHRARQLDARLAEVAGPAVRRARRAIGHGFLAGTTVDAAARHAGVAEAAALARLAARRAAVAVRATSAVLAPRDV